MGELYYKDLSYKISGLLFDVYNYLGPKLKEETYCKYLQDLLKENNVDHQYQYYLKLNNNKNFVGKRYLDFLIEDKIVVEMKVGKRFFGKDFAQVKEYLELCDMRLGLLVLFNYDGVKIHRVLN